MMIGKKRNLNRLVLCFFCILIFGQNIKAQENLQLEQESVIYFCKNIAKINKGLNDFNIRFKGKTIGLGSSVFQIANCVGDIKLIIDSIPNREELERLEKQIKSKVFQSKSIKIDECQFLKKFIFAPFNKRIFTLKVYNAVKYKDRYYVELYLSNKDLTIWVICVVFDEDGKFIDHCTSFFIF